mmetsp:Transcript_13949/g.56141  ORF Transcript_13949/g.56141 Transcript_13949/m.56141 type:complete len:95 (-) Transcript_13949:1692-1976(-)
MIGCWTLFHAGERIRSRLRIVEPTRLLEPSKLMCRFTARTSIVTAPESTAREVRSRFDDSKDAADRLLSYARSIAEGSVKLGNRTGGEVMITPS